MSSFGMTSDTSTPVVQDETRSKRPKRSIWIWINLTLLLIALVLAGFAAWDSHKNSSKLDDLAYQQTYDEYVRDNDLLTPDVGVIQFMHRGFTVTFDTLNYTSAGLELTGTLGNPTQLTITSINFKLSARPFLYKNKEKVIKDWFYVFGGAGEVGSGQTSVPYLGPGKTTTFTMTIPNVKQTSDGYQIAASFANERYAY